MDGLKQLPRVDFMDDYGQTIVMTDGWRTPRPDHRWTAVTLEAFAGQQWLKAHPVEAQKIMDHNKAILAASKGVT